MTTQRRDEHSTEFGLWLRGQLPNQKTCVESIDSKKGYVATNIDFLWSNYRTGDWMLIEEKRFGKFVKSWQAALFKLLDDCCKEHPKYHGFHILRFEHTSPDDGKIWWDSEIVTPKTLLSILRFE